MHNKLLDKFSATRKSKPINKDKQSLQLLDFSTTSIIDFDGYLEPYRSVVEYRKQQIQQRLQEIQTRFGSLENFASWHHNMGFLWKDNIFIYREWAPEAHQLYLLGDFNKWRPSHSLERLDNGIWQLTMDAKDIAHGSEVKVRVDSTIGTHDRLPSLLRSTKQNPVDHSYNGVVWNPPQAFEWSDNKFTVDAVSPLIYEAHVGMATEACKVGTFREFADAILPYIAEQGYNTVQLMAVMEHPYYGSFGYHVSNLYAVSSRFGSPDDLKYLVNKTHSLGLAIIIDIVHSHAVKNLHEGLVQFDGTEYQYFHEGSRGYHELWDSKLYNYGKEEVQRFLLSNLRYWLEEYHLDGFRFDGITSMLYHHHGQYTDFVHYDMYFNHDVDQDALLYLQLANTLTHQINPQAISIAEDMSGMPGLCRPITEGGIDFDYRLGMGVPDLWIKLLKDQYDEHWNISELCKMLLDRRHGERTIAYCESHDQALVGDKTIAFRLMDQEMYWHMNIDSKSHVIDRGIALHKLIRLITIALGGEGYLNFIGNEFGHPEWIDFPREGNDFSYQYARRQWSLKDNEKLRYKFLANFDKSLLHIITSYDILKSEEKKTIVRVDEANKIVIFEKEKLLFVISFNTEESIPNYKFGVSTQGSYKVLLSSDESQYGGFERIDSKILYHTTEEAMHGCQHSLSLYVTNRTGIVLILES